ncbi:hypothetical protein HK097_008910 [Rhizophlyctis rosea]|uniref:Uncharacterized protein n=1 Tax=Rhizophlyctis rosea TaxID=64517 RepID=A0AAD5X490_9FUNG|nr:hypothetical protein HK097_008910 [Rhizophlyctis rosea]
MRLPPSSYPPRGILYFLIRPSLWGRVICPFILTLLLGLIILILSMVYLLPLQARAVIAAGCPPWAAWLTMVIITILESAIITLLMFALIIPIYQDSLFDAVLRSRGLGYLVDRKRSLSQHGLVIWGGAAAGVVWAVVYVFFQILVLLITLPLHAIPILGTMLYCFINGWVLCWGLLLHWDIEFLDLSISESRRRAKSRKTEYFQFGVVATALEIIPLANLLFTWTNVVAAALWVADEVEYDEKQARKAVEEGRPNPPPRLQPHHSAGTLINDGDNLIAA